MGVNERLAEDPGWRAVNGDLLRELEEDRELAG
jgi:hypothetical protein